MTPSDAPKHEFERLLAESWPATAWRDVTVVVAISGGADSVALLRGLVAVKGGGPGQLRAAHFNHHLRGAESDADEAFVRELCEQVGVPCDVGAAASSLVTSGDGLEAAARQVRYAFLQHTAEQHGARYVVTAHTANDQAETILQRIVRGTGIAGLAGIQRARTLGSLTLLRPLLGISRRQVESYLFELGQAFRHDSSNADPSFTRNRIRHELLPLLTREYNPAASDALLRLGQLATEVQDSLRPQIEALVASAVVFDSDQAVRIDCGQLATTSRHLVRELLVAVWQRQAWPLQNMGFDSWQSLAEMAKAAEASSGQRVFSGSIFAQKKGGELLLTRP